MNRRTFIATLASAAATLGFRVRKPAPAAQPQPARRPRSESIYWPKVIYGAGGYSVVRLCFEDDPSVLMAVPSSQIELLRDNPDLFKPRLTAVERVIDADMPYDVAMLVAAELRNLGCT